MKIALIHDDFCQAGGAESLFATIASVYKEAPIYTSLIDWSNLPQSISRDRVRTSFIQKIPFAQKLYKLLLPLYPLAFESFDFSKFNLVISSTTRFSKSIITKPNTVHICYVNSIPRFLWSEKAKKEYMPQFLRFLTKPILLWLKRWDYVSSSRVDHYLANSKNIQDQIKKIYGRESTVLYPFADLDFFTPPKVHNWQLKSQNYYLVVSRLVKWKKIDTAIKACQKLGVNLKIAGTGSDEARLKKLTVNRQQLALLAPNSEGTKERSTDNTIEFLNKVNLETLRELYQNAKALIVTQEEDFGISMVEAQACGLPVIAYEKGGQSEIITAKTGILYNEQTAKSLSDAIDKSSAVKWSQSACRKNSLRFSKAKFVQGITQLVKTYAAKS